jgi:hypothetical protein
MPYVILRGPVSKHLLEMTENSNRYSTPKSIDTNSTKPCAAQNITNIP